MSDLILHQYTISPFSEKVRVVFAIKGLAWRACEQPVINPKPDLVDLTGGYRRIPVLQIGADLYFDSTLIVEELERRFPQKPACGSGMAIANAITPWVESELFPAVVVALFGSPDWDFDDAFIADRDALLGRAFDPAAMASEVPAMEREIRRHLALLDQHMADGRVFIMGDAPDAIDAIVYSQTVFMRWGKGRVARLIDEFPAFRAWEKRVAALGHGPRGPDISRADATAVARAAVPGPITTASVARDGDPRPGDPVRFRYADANSPVLEGRLIAIDDRNLSIARQGADGLLVHIHMPRTAPQA